MKIKKGELMFTLTTLSSFYILYIINPLVTGLRKQKNILSKAFITFYS